MSFFAEPNKDAYTVAPENVTAGKRVGFLEGFSQAYEAQVRGASVFGIQEAMRNLDDEQARTLRQLGVEDVPSLSKHASDPLRFLTDFGNDYFDAAKFYEDGGTPEMAEYLSSYDAKIAELQERFPDTPLQSSADMWNRVKSDAQEAERRVNVGANDFGGSVGGFIGGALGSMNPNTDPLNVATLTVGGVGKTAVGRVATQAGAQGLVEALNQVTGVQEQRRLLGLDYGTGDAIERVGGAIVGGAVVQGFGEVVGMGVRKFFQNTPDDPAPPLPAPQREPVAPVQPSGPPAQPLDVSVAPRARAASPELVEFLAEVSPFGGNRVGRSRGLLDFQDVSAKLDTWDGGRPWEIPPKTDTAADSVSVMNRSADIPDLSQHVATREVDMRARKVDPKIMQRYDQLATEKQAYRIRLEQEATLRPDTVERSPELRDMNADINRLDDRIAKASAKNRKKLTAERDTKIAERDALVEQLNASDTSNMAALRAGMMRVDERMRDIAPAVSRAYARARGKWEANAADREAIVQMMRDGRTEIGNYEQAADFVDRAKTLADQAPILYRANEVEVKADADAADVALAVLRKDMDDRASALEASAAQLRAVLGEEAETTVRIEGYEGPLNLADPIVVEGADGNLRTITVREMLQEQLDSQEDLAAVSSCSIL